MKSRISLVCMVVLMVYWIAGMVNPTNLKATLQIQRAGGAASAMSTAMANSQVWMR